VNPPLRRYAELLLDWNRTVNLTGARSLPEIEAQIADGHALLGVGWHAVRTVIDIGSGGGLPAIPLALALPAVRFALLDANARKCAFLDHAAGTLGLGNIRVLPGRAEELGHRAELREQFDRAISRAAARPGVLLELALPFVKPGGELIAQVTSADPHLLRAAAATLGGGEPRLERSAAEHGTLLVVPKMGPTPADYPRRVGVPGRKPLA
jgi:16S rRNA (guanine527-N7)-methyltransferase